MPIKNGEVIDADELMNVQGLQFKNQAQLLWNTAYEGFNSQLNVATGVPNLKNIEYDLMTSNTATTSLGISYDGANDYYSIPDLTGLSYYVIIEATSLSSPIDGTYVKSIEISSGKWLIYSTESGEGLQKAKIMEQLFSAGSISSFDTITAFKVTSSDDVGKRMHKIVWSSGTYPNDTATGTFGTTTDNIINSWSNLNTYAYYSSGSGATANINFQMPSATVLNSDSVADPSSGAATSTSNEIGTDTSADDKTNPASAVSYFNRTSSNGSFSGGITALIFAKGTMSWDKGTHTDYYITGVMPETTLASDLATEGLDSATLIFQTTSLPTITDCIATWNSEIDADNTLTVSISADGTNYETVTDATIHRFTNTGTNLYIKFEIDRVDTAAEDKISEYAILYNVGAS